jgi:DNA polymerase I-like protein with 3'-5' exonuclease and polymerase domains
MINAGIDPHLVLAGDLFCAQYHVSLPYELVTEISSYNGHDVEPRQMKKLLKDCRQHAKPANFGFPGGMGARTFIKYCAAQGVRLSLDDAQQIKRTWEKRFPEFRDQYFPHHADLTEYGPCCIEQFRSKRWRGGMSFTDVCNTRFSGLTADMTKDAGWEISRACYDPSAPDRRASSALLGCRPVNFIHDQYLVEASPTSAAEAAAEVGRLMVEAGERWHPDVPAATEPCLAWCWSKKSKAVYDEKGRLIPC